LWPSDRPRESGGGEGETASYRLEEINRYHTSRYH